MRFVLSAALVLLACRPVHDPAIPDALVIPLTATTYHLKNGIKVVVVPEPKADLVTVYTKYDAGSIDEPPDQPGVAHLAAHLTYTQLATPTLTLWDALDRSATWISVTPRARDTEFSEQCQAAQLPLVLRLEASRLAGCSTITPQWFEQVRGVVADELAGNPSQRTDRTIAHALYPADDPLSRAHDADAAAIARLTQEQACAFMASHYGPANTAITISGPIDPAAVERLIEADLGRIVARPLAARAPRPPLPEPGHQAVVSADVAEPSLVVAWPVSEDHVVRARVAFALRTLADHVGAIAFGDGVHYALWFPRNPRGLGARKEQLRKLLEYPRLGGTWFAAERTKLLTDVLQSLDLVVNRDAELADGIRPDATLGAIAKLTHTGVEDILEHDLEWSRARVLELEPDGTRPAWSPVELGDPAHSLRETSNAPDLHDVPVPAPDIGVLARARTFTLPNGLAVALVPTSPVPLVHVRLVFGAGNAAEPAQAGVASAAMASLEWLAARGSKRPSLWASLETWRAGTDSSSIEVSAPFMYVDLLFERFAGLSREHLTPDDVRHGLDWMKTIAKNPRQSSWEIEGVLRGSVYGADHPYARNPAPDTLEVQSFDPAAIEHFYNRYLQPDRATLIVTGGFDPDVVARIVEQVFGGWKGSSQPAPMVETHGAGGRFASEKPGDVVELQIQWPGPPLDDHFAAREVLGEMVMSVAPQFYSKWEQLRQGGRYVLFGKLPAATAPQQIAEIARKLEAIGGGSDADRGAFIAARRHGVRWRIGASMTATQWSEEIWLALENGRDLAWLRGLPARKGAVTYDDVAALAKAELAPARATWHVAGPREAVTAVYQALGVEPKWFERSSQR